MLPREIKIKFWKNTFYWSLGIFTAWSLYYYFWLDFYNFGVFIEVLQSTAHIMIAVSLLFGTFTFYTDFLDSKLGYRKYFGLTGYWYLVLHLGLLVLTNPQANLIEPLKGNVTQDQILGLIAFLILTFMASISHDSTMIRLGPKLWRNSLRMGFLIYLVLIPRAFLLESDLWFDWIAGMSFSVLVPPNLIATTIGSFVILFRLSVFPVRFLRKIFKIHKPKAIISHTDHPHEMLNKEVT